MAICPGSMDVGMSRHELAHWRGVADRNRIAQKKNTGQLRNVDNIGKCWMRIEIGGVFLHRPFPRRMKPHHDMPANIHVANISPSRSILLPQSIVLQSGNTRPLSLDVRNFSRSNEFELAIDKRNAANRQLPITTVSLQVSSSSCVGLS